MKFWPTYHCTQIHLYFQQHRLRKMIMYSYQPQHHHWQVKWITFLISLQVKALLENPGIQVDASTHTHLLTAQKQIQNMSVQRLWCLLKDFHWRARMNVFLTSGDDSPAFKELRRCDIEKQSQNINLITCHNDFRTIFSRNTHILGYRNDDQQVKNNLFNHYATCDVMLPD